MRKAHAPEQFIDILCQTERETNQDSGDVLRARYQRVELLPVAAPLWWHGEKRHQIKKKVLTPSTRRDAVNYVRLELGIGEKQIYWVLGQPRSTEQYRLQRPEQNKQPRQASLRTCLKASSTYPARRRRNSPAHLCTLMH